MTANLPMPRGRRVRVQLRGGSRIGITGSVTAYDNRVAVVGGQIIQRRNIAAWYYLAIPTR